MTTKLNQGDLGEEVRLSVRTNNDLLELGAVRNIDGVNYVLLRAYVLSPQDILNRRHLEESYQPLVYRVVYTESDIVLNLIQNQSRARGLALKISQESD